jgi:PAS domain S-box-containing protein
LDLKPRKPTPAWRLFIFWIKGKEVFMFEKKYYLFILLGLLLLFGLYITHLYSFLLFHSLSEIFSIVVACGIFMLAWNSRHLLDNNYLLLLGIAYLFIGGLDLIHTLAYKGMGVFHGYNANLPTQLWIAARYMESLSLLIASFFIGRRLRKNMVLLGYALATAFLLVSIFHWKLFPVCFIEGVGLTPFKKLSEYLISFILIASIVMLWNKRSELDKDVLSLLIASILLTVASELAFTFYIHVYGFSNLVGHYLKIISFYLIYRAIIKTGLERPYGLLFRNLKKSETALRESEERYRRLVELSFNGIAIHSAGRFVFVNPIAAELLAAEEPEQLIGKSFLDMVHFDYKATVLGRVRQVLEEGKSVPPFEEKLIRMDGVPIDVELLSIPTTYQDQPAVQVVFRDITERKKTEAQIIRAKREWELTFDAVPDLIMIIDKKHRILRANRATADRLGVRLDELVGLNCYKAFHGTDEPPDFCPHRQLLANGLEHTAEVHEDRLGGDFLVSVSPLRDPDGTITGSVHVARDITERKQAEEALKSARDGLERRVRERTAELGRVSAQLLSAQEDERKRIARELHDSVGQSLAAMKFKLESTLDQVRQGQIDTGIESLETLVPLLQQLSDEVRRIHTDLRPSLLDDLGIVLTISWFCREFESLYSDIQIEKMINIEEKQIPDHFKIVIFRVLQEALHNVAKHSKAKHVRVFLGGTDGHIELLVKDEGQGFDLEELRSGKELSAGFGLISMKERTELSGGAFSVESSKGRGTAVRASWPIKE